MIPALAMRRTEIADLCRRFGVRRLDVVGSAARGIDFEPERSDADFLVEFTNTPPSLADFFALRDALIEALGRPVDLIMETGVRNPYVRSGLQAARETIYAT
jgi:predicted nucleotidyltransferase